MNEPTDNILRDWLLHRLPAPQAEMLEQRLLTDDAFGERLREAETDLLDDLARGRLGAAERAVVAETLGESPGGRERLRIAKALARVGASASFASPDSQDDRVLAASATASRAGTPWRSRRARRTAAIGLFVAACAALAVVGLRVQRPGNDMPVTGGTESTITLLADRQRGAQQAVIGIPRGAASIRLQLEVESADPQARYDLSIEDAGRTVFNATDLPLREVGPYRFVEVAFPANVLAGGEHTVLIRASDASAPAQTRSIRTRED